MCVVGALSPPTQLLHAPLSSRVSGTSLVRDQSPHGPLTAMWCRGVREGCGSASKTVWSRRTAHAWRVGGWHWQPSGNAGTISNHQDRVWSRWATIQSKLHDSGPGHVGHSEMADARGWCMLTVAVRLLGTTMAEAHFPERAWSVLPSHSHSHGRLMRLCERSVISARA